MAIFAIGDTHLSFDERIEKPMDVFGDRWENHAERLRENWESLVGPEDTVLVCGDISWGLRLEEAMADLKWLDSLPGHKVITKGNHDLWWTSISKLNRISPGLTFLHNTAYHSEREGVWICGTRGWICPGTEGFDEHDDKIYKREVLRLDMSLAGARPAEGEALIAALHYPPCNDRFQASGFTETLEKYGVKTCVYGHLHGKEAFKNGYKGSRNGVEYKLVSLDFVGASPVRIHG